MGALRRVIEAAFVAVLVVLAASSFLAWRSARRLLEAERWVRESAEAISELQDLFTETIDAETSWRGFAIAGDQAHRAASELHVAHLERRMAAILAGAPPDERRALAPLAAAVAAKAAHVRSAIGRPGGDPAVDAAILRTGTELRERVRSLASEARARQEALLAARLAQETRDARRLGAVVLVTGLLSLVAVGAALYRVRRDMAERVRAERERAASMEELRRLEAILEAMPDVVGIAHADATPAWLNRAGRAALGSTGTGEEGRATIFAFCPDWAARRIREEGLPRALAEGSWTGETAYLAASGVEVPCEQLILCHRNEDGTVAFFSTVMRDLRERKEADRLRNELAAMASHELKTPLTAMKGALAVVLDGDAGPIPERVRQLLAMAARNGDRLVRLVDEILEVERIEAGALELAPRPLAPGLVVALAVESARAAAPRVPFVLRDDAPGARVSADPDRLTQVVANLLSNAAKFSPEGARVEVTLAADGERWRLSVTDRGRGIPPEFRKRIFGRFACAEPSDRKERGGTGLGLAIAKAIVERHGGTIGFTSEPGRETTFFVDLPLCPAEGQSSVPRRMTAATEK